MESAVTTKQQNESVRKKTLESVFDWMEMAIVSLVCVSLLFAFVFRTVGVEGTSMVPTLQNKDRLILTHLFYTPERGDVVVLSRIDEGKTPLIKRVIAVAGDTVEITADKKVLLNGQLLDEPYLQVDTPPKGCLGPVTIEEGYIFVLGDNRGVSWDSRDIGPVSLSRVMGKASFRLWPDFGSVS